MKKRVVPYEAPALRIEYLPLSGIARFDHNPKKHDIGALVTSIRRYGFRDAPIFDGTLRALVAGHGRLKALEAMQADGDAPPVGVRAGEGGEWLVPVQLGIDAKSAAEAQAFLIDHNALTVAGGDLGVEGILRLYDQDGLGELLQAIGAVGELPVTLDGEDLDALLGAFDVQGVGMPGLADGDRAPFRQMTFTLHDEQAETVEAAMKKAKGEGGDDSGGLNENTNGNALAYIAAAFLQGA